MHLNKSLILSREQWSQAAEEDFAVEAEYDAATDAMRLMVTQPQEWAGESEAMLVEATKGHRADLLALRSAIAQAIAEDDREAEEQEATAIRAGMVGALFNARVVVESEGEGVALSSGSADLLGFDATLEEATAMTAMTSSDLLGFTAPTSTSHIMTSPSTYNSSFGDGIGGGKKYIVEALSSDEVVQSLQKALAEAEMRADAAEAIIAEREAVVEALAKLSQEEDEVCKDTVMHVSIGEQHHVNAGGTAVASELDEARRSLASAQARARAAAEAAEIELASARKAHRQEVLDLRSAFGKAEEQAAVDETVESLREEVEAAWAEAQRLKTGMAKAASKLEATAKDRSVKASEASALEAMLRQELGEAKEASNEAARVAAKEAEAAHSAALQAHERAHAEAIASLQGSLGEKEDIVARETARTNEMQEKLWAQEAAAESLSMALEASSRELEIARAERAEAAETLMTHETERAEALRESELMAELMAAARRETAELRQVTSDSASAVPSSVLTHLITRAAVPVVHLRWLEPVSQVGRGERGTRPDYRRYCGSAPRGSQRR